MTPRHVEPWLRSSSPIGQQAVGQLPESRVVQQLLHNCVVTEYALRDTNKPMGVAEYQLVEALPKDLEASLPSVEQIERELGEVGE